MDFTCWDYTSQHVDPAAWHNALPGGENSAMPVAAELRNPHPVS